MPEAKAVAPKAMDTHQDPVDERTPGFVIVLLFILLAYFPVFLNLDVFPLRVWDESRQAATAFEMYLNGNYLVSHYNGEPEMWSVKPPLLIWAQTLLIHLLGPGELAIRLPAALAAFFTGWLLLRFCWQDLQRPWLGILACGVLYSSIGFVNTHVARGGDYDAPLILFMLWSLWSIHRWCDNGQRKYILHFFLALGLAALTKSIQAFLFLPGIFFYLLLRKRLVPLLQQKWTYLGTSILVLMIASYYLSREVVNPGYLEAVWNEELWGRYGTVLSGHFWPWDRYLELLVLKDMRYWHLLIPAGIVLGAMHRDERIRNWTLNLTLTSLCYLLVISTSHTKLEWYSAPLMPLFSGLVAISLYVALGFIVHLFSTSPMLSRMYLFNPLFLLLVIIPPWAEIVTGVYRAEMPPWDKELYSISTYLKRATLGKEELEADVIVYHFHRQQLLFYVQVLNHQGKPIQFLVQEDLKPGHRALASEPAAQAFIETHYDHVVIMSNGFLRIYEIKSEMSRPTAS